MSGDVQFEGTPEEWKALVEKSIQKKLLTEIMEADAKDELYETVTNGHKLTAVEWFMDNLPNRFRNAILNECSEEIEQAKQMEKEQIMKAVYDAMGTNFDPNMGRAEQYYNETYNP
jgi:hypothetical protein